MIKTRNIRKKGQEEIVGFVIIIVIVAVVFLVILGLYLGQKAPATQRESGDVGQFLDSAMEYTSECRIRATRPYFSLGELIRECYIQTKCDNDENSCNVLNRTFQEMIEINWRTGEDRPFKGYMFNSTYSYLSNSEEVLLITKGNCTRERIGAEYLGSAQPGGITTSLEICL